MEEMGAEADIAERSRPVNPAGTSDDFSLGAEGTVVHNLLHIACIGSCKKIKYIRCDWFIYRK